MPVDLLPSLSGDKKWSPEKWSPRHRVVVALHLGGDKNKEIAEKLDMSEGRISVILNDPRAVYEIERMAGRVADRTVDTSLRIKLYANEALDEIIDEVRTARDVRVRQKAAFGILDRAGYTPAQIEPEEAAPTLPAEVVERMEATTRELVEHNGTYREVEPTPTKPETAEFSGSPAPGEPRGPSTNGEAQDE